MQPSFLSIIVAILVAAAFWSAQAQPRLMGSWSFDSMTDTTFPDNSGNGHPMVWSGAGVSQAPGVKGLSLNDSVGTEIYIPKTRPWSDSGDFGMHAFSVECWYYSYLDSSAMKSEQAIYDYTHMQVTAADYTMPQGFSLYIGKTGVPTFGLTIVDADAKTRWRTISSKNAVTRATWYHLICTYDSTMMRLYVNGIQQDSLSNKGALVTYVPGDIDARIGCRNQFAQATDHPIIGRTLKGRIDELKVYNFALSKDSAAAHYRPALSAPALVSPTNGAVNQPVSTALTWSTVNGAKSYAVQVATSSAFTTYVRNRTGIAAPRLTLNRLAGGTAYFWRVNATTAGGTSGWAGAWSFSTLPAPAAPVLSAPSNSAVVAAAPVTLSWSTQTIARYYIAQISTSSAFNSFRQYAAVSGNVSVKDLSWNSTYYWRIRAANSIGFGPWSDVRCFVLEMPTVAVLPIDRNATKSTFAGYKGVLTYSLPQPCNVKLTLCDIHGRTIVALDQRQASGKYRVPLSAFNLAAGMYLVHFKAGSFEKKTAIVNHR